MSKNGLRHADPTDHQAAWESLPWYVNGTLEGLELERVEQHVAGCVACRGELKYLHQLGGLLHSAEELPLTPAQGLSALMARIDAEERGEAACVGLPSLTQRIRSWIEPLYQVPPGIRYALITQAAAILLLVGIIAWSTAQPPSATHYTLSDVSDVSVTPLGPGANLRLVFAPETPESRIREILRSVGGEIISGPTALGVYTVVAPVSEHPGLTARAVLEELRAQPELTFAELTAR